MQKIKVKIEINDYKTNEIGIIDKEVIKVQDKKESIKFDTKNLILTKENEELKIVIDFNKKMIEYTLLETNQKFSNKLTVNSLTNEGKQVIINYQIEREDFLLKINYETI